jgi:hypothetical protein
VVEQEVMDCWINGLLECWVLQHSSTPKIQYSITPISRGDGSLQTTAMASLPPACFICGAAIFSPPGFLLHENIQLTRGYLAASKPPQNGIILV